MAKRRGAAQPPPQRLHHRHRRRNTTWVPLRTSPSPSQLGRTLLAPSAPTRHKKPAWWQEKASIWRRNSSHFSASLALRFTPAPLRLLWPPPNSSRAPEEEGAQAATVLHLPRRAPPAELLSSAPYKTSRAVSRLATPPPTKLVAVDGKLLRTQAPSQQAVAHRQRQTLPWKRTAATPKSSNEPIMGASSSRKQRWKSVQC